MKTLKIYATNAAQYVMVNLMLLMIVSNALGQVKSGLFDYIDYPMMNLEQQHYFDSDQDINDYYDYRFANINTELFEEDQLQIRFDNYVFEFEKEDRQNSNDFNRMKWIGKIPGTYDYAHFVIDDDEVVGHIDIEGSTFTVRPLTGGLHVVGEVNLENVAGCETSDFSDRDEETPVKQPFDPNGYSLIDERFVMSQQDNNSRATGECNIRVLIVYTPAVDGAYANILSEAINLMALANTGSANSGLSFNWELAAVKEIAYVEDTFTAFEHRNKLIDPADGAMDIAHSWRNLWSADQVSLLFLGGGGATKISLDPAKALNSTGSSNFTSFTFHHELGHNFMCTHDLINTTEPGSAPYAGYGEPTIGCFRTIMAYQAACGVGSCSRKNVYSDNTGTWNCGGTNYAKGTINNRNTDILNTNETVVVGHRVVLAVTEYFGDYDWNNKEAVHFVASDDLRYNSTGIGINGFEFHNGSEGSFRATTNITLGPGFWAKSGSDFVAYRENCSPIISPEVEEVIAQNKTEEEMVNMEKYDVQVYPNPFSEKVNIEYFISEDTYVSISIYNASGRNIDNPIQNAFQEAGINRIQYNGSKLTPGNYICEIDIDGEIIQKKLTAIK